MNSLGKTGGRGRLNRGKFVDMLPYLQKCAMKGSGGITVNWARETPTFINKQIKTVTCRKERAEKQRGSKRERREE